MAKGEQTEDAAQSAVLAGLAGLQEMLAAQGQRFEERFENMAERVAQLETKQPRIVPGPRPPSDPRAGTYRPPDEIRARGMASLKKAGEQVGARFSNDVEQTIASLPPEYRPAFREGDQVILNPDAIQFGSITQFDYKDSPYPEGRTWREVLSPRNLRILDIVGTIQRVERITPTYEPKYKVVFPGFTAAGGDGFREAELIWYDGDSARGY